MEMMASCATSADKVSYQEQEDSSSTFIVASVATITVKNVCTKKKFSSATWSKTNKQKLLNTWKNLERNENKSEIK